MQEQTDKSWESLYYQRKLQLVQSNQALYDFLNESEGSELFELLDVTVRVARFEVGPAVLRYKVEEIIDAEAERYADENEE